MAVDFVHRLIVTGPPARVRALRRDLWREYPRTVAGETWTEIVPFCFAALYEMAPAARRVEREIPYDPYELSVWPVRLVTPRRAELRYRFQTRNLEMPGLLRALARARPALTFTLATLCLDDSQVEGFRFRGATADRWHMPPKEVARLWDRARRKFRLEDDAVYEDDDAESWVEEEGFTQTLMHWEPPSRRRRRRWWNQPRVRDLGIEREAAMYELLAAAFGEPEPKKKSKKKSKRKQSKRAKPAERRTIRT